MEAQGDLVNDVEVQSWLHENLKAHMGAIVEWSIRIVINHSKRNFESILDQIDRILTGKVPNLDLIGDVGVILAEHLEKL